MMEQNTRMMAQSFIDHNHNCDTGEYLKIYMLVCQGQVMYTRKFGEAKRHIIFAAWYSKYHGSLPWYWTIVMSVTIDIDPIKYYHRHYCSFDPWYSKF